MEKGNFIFYTRLLINILNMVFYRFSRDKKTIRNLFVRKALPDQEHNFYFAVGQPIIIAHFFKDLRSRFLIGKFQKVAIFFSGVFNWIPDKEKGDTNNASVGAEHFNKLAAFNYTE